MLLKDVGPYLLSLSGVLSDYATTGKGLSLGLSESNPCYHPVLSLSVFWGLITLLAWLTPKKGSWRLSRYALAILSFIGAINNIALILPILSGL